MAIPKHGDGCNFFCGECAQQSGLEVLEVDSEAPREADSSEQDLSAAASISSLEMFPGCAR